MSRIKKEPYVIETETQVEESPMKSQERTVDSNDATFRKVQVLANLANACQNDSIVNAIRSLPDGDLVLKIFTEALQVRIKSIMSNTDGGQLQDQTQTIYTQLSNSADLSMEIHALLANFHTSPLIQVLKTLSSNLVQAANAPKQQPVPQNPYAGYQQMAANQAPANNGQAPATPVTPYYQSQIEQTPLFSQKSSNNFNPAPTEPVRGGGINSF
jgi:hypothetical protein